MQHLWGLFITSLLNHFAIGDKDNVTVCENEDAVLKWPGAANSTDKIEYQLWYNGSILLAKWMKEEGFTEFHPLDGRLIYIGVGDIMIRKTHHADSGPYKLIWKSKSANNSSTVTINLHVIVPPTVHCIPNITKEGKTLKAVLPPDDCGIPSLVPSWISGIQNLINGNISVLSFESEIVPVIYTACANGNSARCFQGNVLKLCSDYTVPAFQPQNENSSLSVGVIAILITILLVTLAVALGFCMWRNWECIKRKLFSGTSTRGTDGETDVQTPLMNHTATAGTSTRGTDGETVVQTSSMDNTATESAKSLDKETKLQEKLLMQQKQQQEPGSNHTGKDDVKGAKYPHYRKSDDRLETFEHWPRDHSMKPKDLAVAGFLYQGERDNVTCFFCGGVLGDWKADDNAWEEHERLSPLCEHVKSHKKAGSSPGDSDEIEEIQDIQSRDETVKKEKCILNKGDEKMNEKPPIIEGHLLCRICQKQNALVIFSPCWHANACFACAEKLKKCNLCQKPIQAIIRPYAKNENH